MTHPTFTLAETNLMVIYPLAKDTYRAACRYRLNALQNFCTFVLKFQMLASLRFLLPFILTF